jgi:hypothetical protein
MQPPYGLFRRSWSDSDKAMEKRINLCCSIVVLWGMAACVPNEAPKPEGNQAPSAATPQPQTAPNSPATNFRSLSPRPPSMRPIPLGSGLPAASGAEQRPAVPVASASGAKNPSASAPAAEALAGKGGAIKAVFEDAFERGEIGPDWNLTSPVWRIDGGKLCGEGAKNHPAWLARKLPTNARIEFEAMSKSPDGDLKVELWGDGKSFAKATSYTDASSYIAIFGGWKNTFHVLARIDEHAKDRPELKLDPDSPDLRARPIRPNNMYHFKIERSDGKTVRWYVDDLEIMTFADPNPLKGPGHEYLGFNDWDVPVCFDNLKITPLAGG